MFQVHVLNPWTVGPFGRLTRAPDRQALESAHPDGPVVAFGATVTATPIQRPPFEADACSEASASCTIG